MKTLFTSDAIWDLHEKNQRAAARLLQKVPVFCGSEPNDKVVSGWVFEKTVQHCLRRELRRARSTPRISEQVPIGNRGRADLQVGNVLIEIKKSGFFSANAIPRYRRYRKAANAADCTYLYLTGWEQHRPYREGAKKVFGSNNAFFLNFSDDWNRFINRLIRLLRLAPK